MYRNKKYNINTADILRKYCPTPAIKELRVFIGIASFWDKFKITPCVLNFAIEFLVNCSHPAKKQTVIAKFVIKKPKKIKRFEKFNHIKGMRKDIIKRYRMNGIESKEFSLKIL